MLNRYFCHFTFQYHANQDRTEFWCNFHDSPGKIMFDSSCELSARRWYRCNRCFTGNSKFYFLYKTGEKFKTVACCIFLLAILCFNIHQWIQKILPAGILTFFSTSFTEGRTNLPREAIGPNGSDCLSRGVCTIISKGTYSYLLYSWGAPVSPLDPPMTSVYSIFRFKLYAKFSWRCL